jgi:hypothetical protein
MAGVLFDTRRGTKAGSRPSRPRSSPKPWAKPPTTISPPRRIWRSLSPIAAIKAELKADIAGLKIELKDEITRLKDDMHKWVVGAPGFQTVVILGALVSLIKIFAT